MQLRSLPRVAMQKLLMRFFLPMRVVPACPAIGVSSPSHCQCDVFMIAVAPGWQERHARVTACGVSNLPVITAA